MTRENEIKSLNQIECYHAIEVLLKSLKTNEFVSINRVAVEYYIIYKRCIPYKEFHFSNLKDFLCTCDHFECHYDEVSKMEMVRLKRIDHQNGMKMVPENEYSSVKNCVFLEAPRSRNKFEATNGHTATNSWFWSSKVAKRLDTSVTDPSDVKPSQLSNGNKNSSVGIRSNRKSDDDIDQVDAATNGSMTYSVVTFSGGKRIGSLIRAADVNGHYQVTDLNKNDANKPIKKIQDLLPWEKTHWNLFVTIVTSVDCVWAQIMLPEFISQLKLLKAEINLNPKFPPKQIEVGQIYLTHIDNAWQRIRIEGRNSTYCLTFSIDIGGEMLWLPTAKIFDSNAKYRILPGQACRFSLYGTKHLMTYNLPVQKEITELYLLEKLIVAEIQTKQSEFNGAIEIIAHDIANQVNINAVMLRKLYDCDAKPKIDWDRTKTMEIASVDENGNIYGRFKDSNVPDDTKILPWIIFDLTTDDDKLVKVMADRMKGQSVELVPTNVIRMNLIDVPDISPKAVAILRSKLRRHNLVSVRFLHFDSSNQLLVQIFIQHKSYHSLYFLNDLIKRMQKIFQDVHKKTEEITVLSDDEGGAHTNHKNSYLSSSPTPSSSASFYSCDSREKSHTPRKFAELPAKLENRCETAGNGHNIENKIVYQNNLMSSMVSLNTIPNATLIPTGVKILVTVTTANSPNDLHIRCRADEDEFYIAMMISLQDFYKTRGEFLTNKIPLVKDAAAAQNENDGLWYRVTVADILGRGMVKIHFCDTGHTARIQFGRLKSLPLQFRHIPKLAIPARFKDSKKPLENWTIGDSLSFKKKYEGKEFMACVKERRLVNEQSVLVIELNDDLK